MWLHDIFDLVDFVILHLLQSYLSSEEKRRGFWASILRILVNLWMHKCAQNVSFSVYYPHAFSLQKIMVAHHHQLPKWKQNHYKIDVPWLNYLTELLSLSISCFDALSSVNSLLTLLGQWWVIHSCLTIANESFNPFKYSFSNSSLLGWFYLDYLLIHSPFWTLIHLQVDSYAKVGMGRNIFQII